MSETACSQEANVVAALRSGQWNDALRAHARNCDQCAETMRVFEWIGAAADQLGRNRPAPDPTYLWLRAEIQARTQRLRAPSPGRFAVLTLVGFVVAMPGALAVIALLPGIHEFVIFASDAMSVAADAVSMVDTIVVATIWVGIPMLLSAIGLAFTRAVR